MSKPFPYSLLHRLDHLQAAAWLYELTGAEIDPATLAQACIDAGTPPELDTTRLYLKAGNQSVEAIGIHSVVRAHLADKYTPSIRFVVELQDCLLAEGTADLRSTPLLFRPVAIEALACQINGNNQQDTEVAVLQRELESERAARIAAEEELTEYRAKPIEPRERASLERLVYLLAVEACYNLSQPYKAEELILQEAARRGLKIPTGKGTIANQLKAAAQRANMDAEP